MSNISQTRQIEKTITFILSEKRMAKGQEKSSLFIIIKPLLVTFFPFVWMGHTGLGLMYGLLGPAQPYIAK